MEKVNKYSMDNFSKNFQDNFYKKEKKKIIC